MAVNVQQLEAYIREAAQKRGIDPDVAVRVARSEGLAPGVWQSNVVRNGKRETSYGPFQLLVGGGLGDKFIQQTGLDPKDPSTAYQQVDFALDQAAQGGWSPWYGAAKVGVDDWTGLKGAKSVPFSLAPSNPNQALPGDSMVARNHAPEVAAQTNTSVFGSIAPPRTREAPTLNPIPPEVGEYAYGDDKKKTPLQEALTEMGKEIEGIKAPRMGAFPGGPSNDQAMALMNTMKNPRSFAQMFMQRRLG